MTKDAIKGRAKYVLILIVLLNVLYPVTSSGSIFSLIGFAALYAGLFIVGIFITSDSRAHITWSISIAVMWLVMTVIYAFDPTSFWKTQVSSFILIVFHSTIILVLMRYIFMAEQVTADIIYAACAVYFLLSIFFVPVYGMLESAIPGSFVDNTLGTAVHWQQFVYYSLVTLSTAGYGDILPANMWARMLAGLEATVGVLYVAILVARLVSLYEVRRRS
ncbi:MAG TPA: ion channel [Anaerolineales bacterium]|nr:ion channel [Anaerolineales bacterium]